MIQMHPDDYALTILFAALYGAAFVRACQRYRASKSVKEIFIFVAIISILSVIAVAPEKKYKAMAVSWLILEAGNVYERWRKRQRNKSSAITPPQT